MRKQFDFEVKFWLFVLGTTLAASLVGWGTGLMR